MNNNLLGAISGDIIGSAYELENHRTKFVELFKNNSIFTEETVIIYAYLKLLSDKQFVSYSLDELQLIFKSKIVPYLSRVSGLNLYTWVSELDLYNYKTQGYSTILPTIASIIYLKNPKGEDFGSNLKKLRSILFSIDVDFSYSNMIAELIDLLICNSKDSGIQMEIVNNFILKNDFVHKDLNDSFNFNIIDQSAKYILNISLLSVLNSKSFEDAITTSISVGGKSDTICFLTGFIASYIYEVPECYGEKISKYFKLFDNEILEFISTID